MTEATKPKPRNSIQFNHRQFGIDGWLDMVFKFSFRILNGERVKIGFFLREKNSCQSKALTIGIFPNLAKYWPERNLMFGFNLVEVSGSKFLIVFGQTDIILHLAWYVSLHRNKCCKYEIIYIRWSKIQSRCTWVAWVKAIFTKFCYSSERAQ